MKFTVTFTVTADPGDDMTAADEVAFRVNDALGSDDSGLPYYWSWSDISVREG